jgi:hypothetical protein
MKPHHIILESIDRGILTFEDFVLFCLDWPQDWERREPTTQQYEVIRAIDNGARRVSIRSGHGVGKSTLLAWFALWFLLNHEGVKIPCTAPTATQLQDVLWAELSSWHGRLKFGLKERLSLNTERLSKVGAEKSNFAVARTSRKETPEALQGFHAQWLAFIVDEASGVPDVIFEPVEGALTTDNVFFLMASNPTRTTGFLYDSHHRDKDDWECFAFSSDSSEIVTDGYADRIARKFGKDSDIYRVRVEGQFPIAEDDALLSLAEVNEAVNRERPDVSQDRITISCDVARYGDDETIIITRRGCVVESMKCYRKKSIIEIAQLVCHEIDKTGLTPHWRKDISKLLVNVEENGIGGGVVDAILDKGYPCNPVDVAKTQLIRQDDSMQYANVRAQLWWELREFIRGEGCIPNDEELINQLASIKYGFKPASQKLFIESKDDRKKRGLSSPDRADALMLSFYEPKPAQVLAIGL